MLNTEDNDAITKVGPGTLMGTFMREYWVPAMLSSELPTPDCDPVRVMLLGEQLIGFRDSSGQPGLIANLCPHRGASMFLGRNEENGLRCVYHGWKFDVSGNCVDMPNEPPESNFKDRVKATAYPCVERGGLVWAYMGSRETPPELPGIEGTMLEEGEYRTTATMRECNWLQALEGDIDTAHAPLLHGGHREADEEQEGTFNYYELKNRAAHFVAADTDYGAIYGAYRPGRPGQHYWRIGQFLFPFWTQPPPGLLGYKIASTAWVPMDDHHTMVFNVGSTRSGFGGGPTPPPVGFIPGSKDFTFPNSTGWFGRFVMIQNERNDWLMDRELQASRGKYSGIPGSPFPEDSAVQISMGPILDRRIEHVGTSDLMILRVRQRLLSAAAALNDHKSPPPGVDDPAAYGVRSGGVFIPEGEDWLEYIADLLPAFVDHPELDISVTGGIPGGSLGGATPGDRPS